MSKQGLATGLSVSASAPELGFSGVVAAHGEEQVVAAAVASVGRSEQQESPAIASVAAGAGGEEVVVVVEGAGAGAAAPANADAAAGANAATEGVAAREAAPSQPARRNNSPLARKKKEISIEDLIKEYAPVEEQEPQVESATDLLKKIKSVCSMKIKRQNVEANRKLVSVDPAVDPERAREVAGKEALVDQTFPMWIKKRHDFQQVFQRFAFDGINDHEVVLDALSKHPDERKGDTVSALMKWAHNFPIFSELSDRECSAVARKLRMQAYNAGDYIFKQGDVGYSFFMIFEGAVEVLVDGKRVKVQGAGESFGDLALKTDQPRAASIRVMEKNTVCAVLRSFNFREALAKFQSEQLNEAATFLKTMSMFESWSKNKLAQLGSLVSRVEFMEGDVICRQGDALQNSSLHLIQDGMVECYRFFS